MSLTTVAGQFVTLQYPRAFVLPKENEKFYDLVRISLLSVFAFSLLILILLLIGRVSILQFFKAEALGSWIFLIPAAVFLIGINDIWRSWNIRVKEFKKGALAKIISTLFTRVMTLIYGVASKGGGLGLVLGDFVSKPADSLLIQTKAIRKALPVIWKGLRWKQVWATAKEFKQYPFFVLPGSWVFNFITQMPVIFLSIYFTKDQLGYYSMTNSLFVLPMSLLTTALAPVFLQKIAETVNEKKTDVSGMVKKLFWMLHFTGLFPFSVLIVFGDKLLPFVLGSQWQEAGYYASVMGFYFIFFINSYVLNALYRVYNKEKIFLAVNILMLILCVLGLLIGAVVYNDAKFSIIGFCIGNAIGQITHIAYNLKFAGLPAFKYLLLSVFFAAAVIFIFYLLRFLLF